MLIFVLNLLFQMLGKIAGKGLALSVLMEFFFLNLAWIVALAVPMAVLIATLMAFGRFSADNEITAMKASGISILSLLKPALAFGLIVGGLLFYFNDRILPEFNHRSRLLTADISRKKPTLNLQEGVFVFDVPNIVLRAGKIEGETSKLINVIIYDESDRKYQTTVLAKEGQLDFSYETGQFVLTLYDGTIHRLERYNPENYQETLFQVSKFRTDAPDMLLQRRESTFRSDREQNSLQMMQIVKKLKTDPRPNWRRINTYLVEIHKKFSIPTACLVFILVGVPMGIMFRSGGLGVSGGLALFFFLIYWVCLIGGEDLADRGYVHPWLSMWFPNILMTGLGIFLILRNIKGYALLDITSIRRALPRKIRGREIYPGENHSSENNHV
jgi:lipopolysaccharide export system permease protein